MKLLVVLLITLVLNNIEAKNGGTKLKCLANSCKSCASDSNCVWCDNRCIDKTAFVLCGKRISDAAKCKESTTKDCCEYKGQRYDIGEKFMDDCNNCTCQVGGSVSCTEKLCNVPTCNYNGKIYQEGDSFPSSDKCNQCSCNNGLVRCTKKACVTTCNYQGKIYSDGQTFLDEDGCNTCICVSGEIRCTDMACLVNCQSDNDCDSGYFCSKNSCESQQQGTCLKCDSEAICTTQYEPVCGCDGQTYSNDCAAKKSCVNIKSPGECQPQPQLCTYDHDCNYGQFCEKESCDTEDAGTCTECNSDMICTTQYDPVCGCDERTYNNSCEAAKSCVNVKSSGQCQSNQPQQTSCLIDHDCSSGYFCSKDSCDASLRGTCTVCERNSICTTVSDPVCGCDEKTYSNPCDATRNCVNIKIRGECKATTIPQPQQLNCRTNNDCGTGKYCAKETCDCDQGTCTQLGLACNGQYDPVCGCDGKTYSNQCEAGSQGANVKSRGECPAKQSGGTSHPH